jgi:hypothetical protein
VQTRALVTFKTRAPATCCQCCPRAHATGGLLAHTQARLPKPEWELVGESLPASEKVSGSCIANPASQDDAAAGPASLADAGCSRIRGRSGAGSPGVSGSIGRGSCADAASSDAGSHMDISFALGLAAGGLRVGSSFSLRSSPLGRLDSGVHMSGPLGGAASASGSSRGFWSRGCEGQTWIGARLRGARGAGTRRLRSKGLLGGKGRWWGVTPNPLVVPVAFLQGFLQCLCRFACHCYFQDAI